MHKSNTPSHKHPGHEDEISRINTEALRQVFLSLPPFVQERIAAHGRGTFKGRRHAVPQQWSVDVQAGFYDGLSSFNWASMLISIVDEGFAIMLLDLWHRALHEDIPESTTESVKDRLITAVAQHCSKIEAKIPSLTSQEFVYPHWSGHPRRRFLLHYPSTAGTSDGVKGVLKASHGPSMAIMEAVYDAFGEDTFSVDLIPWTFKTEDKSRLEVMRLAKEECLNLSRAVRDQSDGLAATFLFGGTNNELFAGDEEARENEHVLVMSTEPLFARMMRLSFAVNDAGELAGPTTVLPHPEQWHRFGGENLLRSRVMDAVKNCCWGIIGEAELPSKSFKDLWLEKEAAKAPLGASIEDEDDERTSAAINQSVRAHKIKSAALAGDEEAKAKHERMKGSTMASNQKKRAKMKRDLTEGTPDEKAKAEEYKRKHNESSKRSQQRTRDMKNGTAEEKEKAADLLRRRTESSKKSRQRKLDREAAR